MHQKILSCVKLGAVLSLFVISACKGPQGPQGIPGRSGSSAYAYMLNAGLATNILVATGTCSENSIVSCEAQEVTAGTGLSMSDITCTNGQFESQSDICSVGLVYLISCWVTDANGIPGSMGQPLITAQC